MSDESEVVKRREESVVNVEEMERLVLMKWVWKLTITTCYAC